MANSVMELRNRIIKNNPHIETVTPASLVTFNTDMQAPLSNLKIHFSPTQDGTGDPAPDNVRNISGWTGITVNRAAKNWFNTSFLSQASAYPNAGDYAYYYTDPIYLPPNTQFTISPDNSGTLNLASYYLIKYYTGDISSSATIKYIVNEYKYGSNRIYTFTTGTLGLIQFAVRRSSSQNMQDILDDIFTHIHWQLELGPTNTAYTPYTGQNLTLDWTTTAGTVYGGYMDLIRGVVVKEWDYFPLTTLNTSVKDSGESSTAITRYYMRTDFGSMWDRAGQNLMCNKLKQNINNTDMAANYRWQIPSSSAIIYWRGPECTTAEGAEALCTTTDYKFYIKLKTPVAYQIDPITLKTLRGLNHIWSTANGDIEASYWTHGVPATYTPPAVRIINYCPAATAEEIGLNWRKNQYNYYYVVTGLIPNHPYTLSCTINQAFSVNNQHRFYLANNTRSSYIDLASETAPIKKSVTLDSNPDGTIIIQLNDHFAIDSERAPYITNIQLEHGSVAHAYTPYTLVPNEYQVVGYLTTDGNQYILGPQISFDGEPIEFYCEYKVATLKSYGPYIFNAGDTKFRLINKTVGTTKTNFTIDNAVYGYDATVATNTDIVAKISNGYGKIGTADQFAVPVPSAKAVNNTAIFTYTQSPTNDNYLAATTLYALKLDGSSGPLLNFVPCIRKQDDVAGLYETVSHQFYSNSGTGIFTVSTGGKNYFDIHKLWNSNLSIGTAEKFTYYELTLPNGTYSVSTNVIDNTDSSIASICVSDGIAVPNSASNGVFATTPRSITVSGAPIYIYVRTSSNGNYLTWTESSFAPYYIKVTKV